MKSEPKRSNPWVSLFICALAGLVILCFQFKAHMQRRQLRLTGETTTGYLTKATRHSVYFIPMGYSLEVSYAGQTRDLDVSRELFYRHVNADGKYRSGSPIEVRYQPTRPSNAELPEMLTLSIWWLGGPMVGYFFGGLLLFLSLLGMRNLSRRPAAQIRRVLR